MAKVNIIGSAVVITSSVKLEDIKTVQKYRPDALTLKGGEDGKEPVFAIGVTETSSGNMSKYGAEFASRTTDAEGMAQITLARVPSEDDPKEYVADAMGAALVLLGKWEETLPDVLAEVAAEREAILANITVG